MASGECADCACAWAADAEPWARELGLGARLTATRMGDIGSTASGAATTPTEPDCDASMSNEGEESAAPNRSDDRDGAELDWLPLAALLSSSVQLAAWAGVPSFGTQHGWTGWPSAKLEGEESGSTGSVAMADGEAAP